jgi:Spore Coat Protein U domain
MVDNTHNVAMEKMARILQWMRLDQGQLLLTIPGNTFDWHSTDLRRPKMLAHFTKSSVAFALCALGVVTAMPASAADTKDLNVTANVTGVCKFRTTTPDTLPFGTLDPSVGTDVNASVNVLYWCTKGVTNNVVTAGQGQNFTGGKNNMKLATGTDLIPYTLSITSTGTPGGPAVNLTAAVSGTVLGTDYTGKTAGSYSDLVVLTVNP